MIDEFITPHVDLEGFSKLVLGKYWRRATPEQRKQFLTHFHALALGTYATALTADTDIPIKDLPMREESRENFATVRTVVPLTSGSAGLGPRNQATPVDWPDNSAVLAAKDGQDGRRPRP